MTRTCERFANSRNLAKWLRLLLSRPRTLREMADGTGMHYETLRTTVNTLHDEGVLHVATWREDTMGRQTVAVYALGFDSDVPRRKAKTQAQRTQKYKRKSTREDEPLERIGAPLIRSTALEQAFGMRGPA